MDDGSLHFVELFAGPFSQEIYIVNDLKQLAIVNNHIFLSQTVLRYY